MSFSFVALRLYFQAVKKFPLIGGLLVFSIERNFFITSPPKSHCRHIRAETVIACLLIEKQRYHDIYTLPIVSVEIAIINKQFFLI